MECAEAPARRSSGCAPTGIAATHRIARRRGPPRRARTRGPCRGQPDAALRNKENRPRPNYLLPVSVPVGCYACADTCEPLTHRQLTADRVVTSSCFCFL